MIEGQEISVVIKIEKKHWSTFSKRLSGVRLSFFQPLCMFVSRWVYLSPREQRKKYRIPTKTFPKVALQINNHYAVIINAGYKYAEINCICEYLQNILAFTSSIYFLGFYSLSDDLIRKMGKAVPKWVPVYTVHIEVCNLSENLR